MEKKDRDLAWASLICGLLIWVPLFNSVLGPLAVIFGVVSLRRCRADSLRFGGQRLALAGIALGAVSTVFLAVTLYIKLFKPELL